jgi:glycosyltransferase involved in cell wall biosynthesis/2-polyprenyl-3-methyl-5-hydroxy-6-metoxy-1,4-benzoquinol methylase
MNLSDHSSLRPDESQHSYGEQYYKNYPSDSGLPYERADVWLNFFAHIAERIIEHVHPRTALDVGCAKGFLVEALRDRGVEAFGLDISEYAIGQIRKDIRPFCWVGSAADALTRRYDLIVCIEVLEHLSEIDAQTAVANLCEHSDDILFSSSPDHHPDPTHVNVQPVEYWAGLFAAHGFYRDLELDANFIARHAVRFRKSNASLSSLVKAYEQRLWAQMETTQDLETRVQELASHLTHGQAQLSETVAQLAKAGAQLDRETQRRERVENQLAEAAAQLERQSQRLVELQTGLDEKENQRAELAAAVEEVNRSLGFQLLCRYGGIKNRWLPNGSRQRALYDFMAKGFKVGVKNGFGGLLKKSAVEFRHGLYSAFHFMSRQKTIGPLSEHRPLRSWGNEVLVISGSEGDMERYRCHHAQEQLGLRGVSCEVRHMSDPALPWRIPQYDLVIFHRVPWFESVEKLIRQARERGALVLLDIDDLIFDIDLVSRIDALRTMDKAQRDLYLDGVRRYRQTIELCDGALVSTDYLARAMAKLGKPAWVHRNALSAELIKISDAAFLAARPRKDQVIIGYASGTRTHNRDFQEAQPALRRTLERHPQAELWIVGHLDLDETWEPLQGRVRRIPFVPWRELPHLLAQLDINLAPLEPGNPFCEAKSELKYFEAGIVGVPTIASKTGAFEFAIRHGENGLLAEDEEGWGRALDRLVSDPKFRLAVGSRARQDVLQRYHPQSKSLELIGTLNRADRAIRGRGEAADVDPHMATAIFPEHALAHDLLDGLVGLEIGAAAHNPFGLRTRNVAVPEGYEFYISHELQEMKVEPVPIHLWASGDNLPVKNESEDFVISSHVVEHLPNLIGAFQEWNRVVRDGGYIFMIVPRKGALAADEDRELTSLSHFIEDYRRASGLTRPLARYLWQKFYSMDGRVLQQSHLAPQPWLKTSARIFRNEIIYGKWSIASALRGLAPWNPHSIDGVPGGKFGHYHTFTPDSLIDVVSWMGRQNLCAWELVRREDVDSKVGNGFTLVFRVNHSKPNP